MKKPSSPDTAAHTELFLSACGLAVFMLAAIWAVFFVPMNMDEAGLYHMLGCSVYPFAPLHTLRAGCMHGDDLLTPIGLQIARSQFYVGIWNSILYAPFYFLIHAEYGQYIFGLLCLLLFAFLTSRECARPWLAFSIILAFFPFLFQFVHDTGPVKFAMLMFPVSAIFLQRILYTPPPLNYGYVIILSLLFIAAMEEKPFFLYILPSIGLFSLALSAQKNAADKLPVTLKKAAFPLAALMTLSAAGFLFLLLSINSQGQFYGLWLADLVTGKLSLMDWLGALLNAVFYWPAFANYTYDLATDDSDAILFKIAAVALTIFCIWATRRHLTSKLRSLLLISSFASSVLIFLIQGNTWAGHHFIFLWPPLIVLFIDCLAGLTPGLAAAAVAVFLALNLCSVLTLTQETPRVKNSGEREAIFHYFADDARATQSIINFSSWGGYFIQSLYGPKNQLVTYSEPYDTEVTDNLPLMPASAQQLLLLSRQTGRVIYNVCFGPLCTAPALDAAFGNQVHFVDALPGLPNWHVFAAMPRLKN